MGISTQYEININSRKMIRWIIVGMLVLIVMSIGFCSFHQIPAGHRAVLMTWGQVHPETYGEGPMWRIPIMQKIQKIDCRIHKIQTETSAPSKDMQETFATVALNLHVMPEYSNWMYRNIGTKSRVQVEIIDPAVQDTMKAVTAEYTAAELIGKREAVSDKIKIQLRNRLYPYGLYVVDFSFVNFQFTKGFMAAIEAKQEAEQSAMKAKNDLERVKIDAEQKIATAKAEAESLRLQKENVSENLLRLRAIEKWDGKMPYYTGGPLPFINAGK